VSATTAAATTDATATRSCHAGRVRPPDFIQTLIVTCLFTISSFSSTILPNTFSSVQVRCTPSAFMAEADETPIRCHAIVDGVQCSETFKSVNSYHQHYWRQHPGDGDYHNDAATLSIPDFNNSEFDLLAYINTVESQSKVTYTKDNGRTYQKKLNGDVSFSTCTCTVNGRCPARFTAVYAMDTDHLLPHVDHPAATAVTVTTSSSAITISDHHLSTSIVSPHHWITCAVSD
jgi:hypothetical protein